MYRSPHEDCTHFGPSTSADDLPASSAEGLDSRLSSFTFRLLQRYPRHGSSLDETLAHSVDVLPDNQVKTDCTVCYRVEACQPAGR
ncbi:hypothetical protein PF004_g17894 [Phytophthora fragariae]|uniref:Uncharacterized protein n=1 Tax=Phytophthora fragariae TaxID=53985 RepID=A0A6G0NE32_9STRA|nr:hypothetical protein PF004_g17894 [Phytophthora fragariae]